MIARLVPCGFALALFLAPVAASAQLFGPSDEQKAQEAAQDAHLSDLDNRSQALDARIRELEDRVRGLTQSLSQATGTNEELQHQIQVQNDKIDRMQKDFAYRLCTLSAQQLGASDQLNCAAAGTASAPQPYAPAPGGLQPGASLAPLGAPMPAAPAAAAPSPAYDGSPGRGRPPGVLGTLPAGPGGAVAPLPQPSGTAQYDAAMNLLSRAQYSEAAAAFRAYADANPQDQENTPQAIYWVANISFIQQDYASAARTFAELIKKYPKSLRAPDAMLKLAQSFMAMGQKSDGCTTLGLIKNRYPDASPQTLSSAATLRKTACTK